MKRIALINTPMEQGGYEGETTDSSPELGYIAAALRKEGFICDIINEYRDIFPDGNYGIVMKAIEYDFIGIGTYIHTFQNTLSVANGIRETQPGIPIVLGGYHATRNHKSILRDYDCFDACFLGEGEERFPLLVRDYFDNDNQFNTPIHGVSYKNLNGERVIAEGWTDIQDLDSIPFLPRKKWKDFDKTQVYFQNDIMMYFSMTRGCINQCVYCLNSFIKKHGVRKRSIENILEEIKTIDLPPNTFHIKFTDNDIGFDPDLLQKTLEGFHEIIGPGFTAEGFIKPRSILRIGKERLKHLHELGLHKSHKCFVGIENGSEAVLKRYNRRITRSEMLEVVKICEEVFGHHNMWYGYIMFNPDTTVDELAENIEFLKEAGIWKFHKTRTNFLYRRMEMNEFNENGTPIMSNWKHKCPIVQKIYDEYMEYLRFVGGNDIEKMMDGTLNSHLHDVFEYLVYSTTLSEVEV